MSPFNQNIDDITYKQLLKRKQKACRHVYNLYQHPVYNLAFRMLQNQQDAQDISQQSFLAVFQKAEQWSQSVPFGQWLKRIVINQCLDCLKKYCPEMNYEQPELANHTGQQQTILYYDSQHDANHYLSQLPPIARTVMWLYEAEGLTHAEIAQLFQRSISFSKSQLARSKQLLKQNIEPDYNQQLINHE